MTLAGVSDVLGVGVRIQGQCVGHVSGLVLDASRTDVLGLEVTSVDARRRFLPRVAASSADGMVEADSVLHFVDSMDTYVSRGAYVCRRAQPTDARGDSGVGGFDRSADG
jgi:hypothetical protein